MMLSRRTVGVLAAAAATGALVAGCGVGPGLAQLDFNDVEPAKITAIEIGDGSGDVVIRTSTRTDTAIKRTVRYGGDQPGRTYRVDGSTLYVDTRCGDRCSVSYVIEAPAGVTVRGGTSSGDVELTGVSTADISLSSGDAIVRNASGPVTVKSTSGNITISDVKGVSTLTSTSGDVRATGLGGNVTVDSTSGDVQVALAVPAGVKAHVTSGDLEVTVPRDHYRVSTRSRSGDSSVSVQDEPSATNVLDLETTSGDLTVRGT